MKPFRNAQEVRKFAQCDQCPWSQHRMVLPEASENANLTLVEPRPDPGKDRFMLNAGGVTVRTILLNHEYGFRPHFTGNVLCDGPGKPPKEAIAACAPRLTEEMSRVGSSSVVLMGKEAASNCDLFGRPFRAYKEVENRTHQVRGFRFRAAPTTNAMGLSANAIKSFNDDLNSLIPNEDAPAAPPSEAYYFVQSQAQAKKLLSKIPADAFVSVDIETDGLDWRRSRIITIQVSWAPGVGYAFPFELLTPEEWNEIFLGRNIVTHNGKFDAKFLWYEGISAWPTSDTMIHHFLLDERPGTHSLGVIAPKYVGADKWGHLVTDGDGNMNLHKQSVETVARYGARDADLTLRLHRAFIPKTEPRFITKVLHEAQNSLVRTEMRGIRIDKDRVQDMFQRGQNLLDELETKMRDVYGLENPRSPKQILELLKPYEVDATNEVAIRSLIGRVPLVADLMEYRHTAKAVNTYLANIDINSPEGRYHPEYGLTHTETGRLTEKLILLIPRASEGENLDRGQRLQLELRSLFVPDEGKLLIQADAAQAEVRMAAWLSGDLLMIQDVNNEVDLHSVIAIQAFDLDIPLEPYATLKKRVNEHHAVQRDMAKTGVFAVMYGATAATVARNLNIPVETAQRIVTAIYSRYKTFKAWQDSLILETTRNGSITTPWGRTRRFPFQQVDRKRAQAMAREAVNFPIQAMANDMNLEAFVRVENSGFETLFLVHDSIVIQSWEDDVEAHATMLKEIAEGVLHGHVNFKYDTKVGRNWGDAE